MKKFLIGICALMLPLAGCSKKDPSKPNNLKRYNQKSIHGVYKYSGNNRGQEEFFIADYGKYEAHIMNIEMFQQMIFLPRHETNVTRLWELYNLNPASKQIRHQRSPLFDSLYHLSDDDLPTPDQQFEQVMKDNYFKKQGTEVVNGYTATKWTQLDNGSALWMAGTLLVKQYLTAQEGYIQLDLVSLDTNWVVDTSVFSLPKDFQFVEVKPGEPLTQ
jgi:hypothetical protein